MHSPARPPPQLYLCECCWCYAGCCGRCGCCQRSNPDTPPRPSRIRGYAAGRQLNLKAQSSHSLYKRARHTAKSALTCMNLVLASFLTRRTCSKLLLNCVGLGRVPVLLLGVVSLADLLVDVSFHSPSTAWSMPGPTSWHLSPSGLVVSTGRAPPPSGLFTIQTRTNHGHLTSVGCSLFAAAGTGLARSSA